MLAYTYIKQGKFELIEKPKPELRDSRDAIAVSYTHLFITMYGTVAASLFLFTECTML